ncbi:DUF1801 domain-containing protein [bacterium]|jgi:hypothetical protein|nr:DUF1801 domain-containing protein [bacterium]
MLSALDEFYSKQDEPRKSVFLFLRSYISKLHEGISEEWKYRLPFFYLNGKMFCYLWYDKGTGFPYLAFVDGGKMTNPILESGNRKRMKILTIKPSEDLPILLLDELFKEAIAIRA